MSCEDVKLGERGLLVAAWGLPWRWGPACYKLAGHEAECEDDETTSVTEFLLRTLEPGRTLLLLLDTAVAGFLDSGPSELDYPGLKRILEDKLLDWAAESGLNYMLSLMRSNAGGGRGEGVSLSLRIVPGKGVYGGWEFGRFKPKRARHEPRGPMASFYAEALHYVLKELVETRAERIAVDMTHGLNYTSILLYKAVDTAVDIYLLTDLAPESVLVEAYNSEPYPQGGEGKLRKPRLHIHRVHSYRRTRDEVLSRHLKPTLKIPPTLRDFYTINSLLEEAGGTPYKVLARTLGERTQTLFEGLQYFMTSSEVLVRSIFYSLPLAAILASHELLESREPATDAKSKVVEEPLIQQVVKAVDSVLEIRDRETIVNTSGKAIIPSLVLEPENLERLYLLSAFYSYAGLFYQRGRSFNEVLEKGVSLDTLKSILNNLSPHTRILAKTELSAIEKACKPVFGHEEGRGPRCFIEKSNIHVGSEWPNQVKCPENAEIDRRNLIAHGGMLGKVTQLLIRDDGSMLVRYIPDCWRKIKEGIRGL